MVRQAASMRFFLGAETPRGYLSLFSRIALESQGWTRFILKGGPEAADILEKLSELLEQNGRAVWKIPCSENPDRMDAVLLPEEKIIVADGTPPHSIELPLPGVCGEVIYLGDCRERGALTAYKQEILEAVQEYRLCTERCRRFLSASGALIQDVGTVAAEDIDREKLERFAQRYAANYFGRQAGKKPGEEYPCFLSAVTPRGITGYWEEAQRLCPDTWILEDAYGAVSRLLLSRLRELALEYGEEVISCYCPISPHEKLDHLLFPRLGKAILTSGRFHKLSVEGSKRVHAERFSSMEHIRMRQKKLGFHIKAARQLIEEAGNQKSKALSYRSQIEALYRGAADRSALEKKAQDLCRIVMQMAGQSRTADEG